MTSEQQAALDEADAIFTLAFAKFDAIRQAYRAREIDDATFLSAQDEHKLALAAFDEVYFAIQNASSPED